MRPARQLHRHLVRIPGRKTLKLENENPVNKAAAISLVLFAYTICKYENIVLMNCSIQSNIHLHRVSFAREHSGKVVFRGCLHSSDYLQHWGLLGTFRYCSDIRGIFPVLCGHSRGHTKAVVLLSAILRGFGVVARHWSYFPISDPNCFLGRLWTVVAISADFLSLLCVFLASTSRCLYGQLPGSRLKMPHVDGVHCSRS
ncbi:hypothetical protein AVEN_111362-1 [Araneus ventricosus]|uniref:Uncharacterized protein n=1 Tax=Araneus ventricosus TaxID=182803 RepID=A0A4Y2MKB5_ARAVE|nr:hypothetical protein AVEN_111362-1 [Araneus ventricosus]